MDGIEKVLLSVPDMTCTHCVNAVSKVLKQLNGVEKFKVSLKNKTIIVEYDKYKVSLVDIKLRLKEKGYSSTVTPQ